MSLRKYVFMTGLHQFRIEASSLEEAIATAISALQASPDTAELIRSTIYEEGAHAFFTDSPTKARAELRAVPAPHEDAALI